ncbi:hypothetical protein [Janthinobacterium sp. 35]|uniref:hypothetical protein n=1 Tax=Janthinobacterium sp. 35 TaxID=2035210 RepID=UPI00117AE59F|nr:hypothetical protein [Janthinobacterium sp. 35]
MASAGQLTYAPPFMVDMLVLRKRIETNKKEELYVVKFSNVRRINKKKARYSSLQRSSLSVRMNARMRPWQWQAGAWQRLRGTMRNT